MIKKICVGVFLFFCFIITIIACLNIKNYFVVLQKCFEKDIALTDNLFMLICFIFALIFILFVLDIILVLYKKQDGNKGINIKKEDGTYGTANWMNENTMKEILGYCNEKPGIILGKYKGEIVRLPFDSYFNKNIAVFGSSGSMKTIAFLITNLLELSKYRKSIILTDPKGEIYQKTSLYFRKIGYEVRVFNLKDMKHSDRWNPLLEIEKIDDVQTSAEIIISNTQKKDRGRR